MLIWAMETHAHVFFFSMMTFIMRSTDPNALSRGSKALKSSANAARRVVGAANALDCATVCRDCARAL